MATINKVSEQSLLCATSPPVFHTEPRLRLDLECILMKDFLFDSSQTFYHAISQTPNDSPTLGLSGQLQLSKFFFFFNGLRLAVEERCGAGVRVPATGR